MGSADRNTGARWTRRARHLAVLVASLSLVAGGSALAAPPGPQVVAAPSGAEVVPDSYIVVLADGHPSAVAQEHVQRHGAELRYVYEHAFSGYAATMPARAAAAVARDPRVAWVEPETIETVQSQQLPTGIDRIETDRNPTVTTDGTGTGLVDIPVAVIDTGIAAHPDLNLAGRVDCTVSSGGGPFASYSCVEGEGDDGNGHGTHVGGTIGAVDNGVGVVGVAPGTPLWSVKVCPTNSCPSGAINAGIDWVAGKKADAKAGDPDGVDFAAANFSISSADSDNSCANPANATHAAICGLVGEGVSFVMAAGNDNREKVPYPVALSVSAIADFDGVAGGAGEPTCRTDEDDTLASFSNYGEKVRIAAPGVCILSTWNDGGYNTISGTSMAAPHVAGAVALYLHANGQPPASNAAGVAAIEEAITDVAHPQGTSAANPCSYDDARLGGPLLFVNAGAFAGDDTCGVAGEDDAEPDPEPGDPDPEPGDIELSASGYKVRGVKHADLSWSGATSNEVDILRDGVVIATVADEDSYTDNIGTRGGGSYTYQVCEAGSDTCSNEVTVTF